MEKPLHSSFQLIQKYRPALNLLPLILLTALLSLANLRATAEGTKQMEPNTPSAANGSLGLVFYNGGWTFNGYRIPFAAAGCLPKYRLNVYIANPGAETVYFGFTQDGTDALYFRLIDPDGLPVPGFDFTSQPTAGNSGYINSYTEAIAGPKFGAVNPTGYDPLSFVPTKVGNYYIEFATDASGNVNFNANGQTLEYFDLSVYDGTTEKPGRLWSKAWQFNNQITGNHAPATDFYILSDDSIVTKLNINKWGGGHFMFYCNQWGAVNTGNWIDDRKSLNDLDQFSWPGDVPQYKVFLNDPDINIFPTGTFGQICDVSSNSNCDGTVDILLKVNKPGSMSLTIDVDPQGSNSGEDVTLTANVLGSTGCSTWESIPWDGNNGFGVPVQNGATINMNIDYLNGLTNLPIYDIETNSDGIMVDLVRPPSTTGSSHLQIQWDDTNLIPMAANVTKTEFIGCQYPGVSVNPPYGAITGCHDWPMEEDNTFNDVFHGNFDIINSWWYYLTQGTINLSLVIKRLPETPAVTPSGNNPVCVGQTGIVYTIPAIANAQSYIWTLPDGTVDTTATNSITLNFPTLASGGTLFVHGNNTSCGNGLNSPALTIVVNPDPLPTIAGTLAMCSGTTQTYNAAPLTLTSYTWTATNGTIIGSNTLPAVTVQWTAAGTQNLELVTTSFNCGTRTTTQTVTVHPLPQPGFSYANNCAGQIVQFTDNTTIATGSVTGWSWNFGDASPVSTLQNPTHTYAVGNTYPVTLTSTSDQGCQASASLMVPVTTPPSANAGVNNSVCANSTYTVVGATASNYSILNWTSSGTGIFNNASFLNPVYSPSAADITAGFVTLTLTANGNTPCGNTTSSITLTINPLPLANAGLDVNTCQGMNFTVSDATALNTTVGGIAWTENGPGSLINANTLTPTYIPVPGETGSVTLTITIGGSLTCLSETSTDSKVLTFTPLPDVTAGADATICAANNYTLNGTAQFCGNHSWSCSGDGTFSNPNLLNAVYSPGPADIAAGSVSLTLTGEGTGTCVGIFDSDAMTLIIDPMPTAYAGIDDAFCVLNPIPVTGATATNYTTLQWFGGDGAFNNNTLLSPTYMPGNIDFNAGSVILTLAVHGALSCASQTLTDTRTFSVSPYPLVGAGPDDYICSNVTQYQLNGVGNNYNAATVLWTVSGGDGTLSDPTIFNPVYFAGPIDLTTTDRNITFTLTLQGIGNCSSVTVFDDILLKIDPTPISNAGPDDEICGQRPYQMNAIAQFQNSIVWTTTGDGIFSNPNSLNPTYTPGPNDVGTTVILSLDLSGCQSLTGDDFMWLTVHPDPSSNVTGSTSICEATSTPVSIALTGTPPWSITYTDGTTPVTVNGILSSPFVFTVSPPVTTSYWVLSGNDAFCNIPPDSIHGLASVLVNPLPDPFRITVTNDGFFCEGTPGVLIGLAGSEIGMTYELLRNGLPEGTNLPGTGAALNFGLKDIPGQYAVRGTNPVGNCQVMMQDTINVVMNPTPVTDFTTNEACTGDTTIFTVSGNFIARISQWHWDFGDGTFAIFNAPTDPWHVYPTYGTYTVTLSVEDTNNCTYSISHPVEVRPHPTAFFTYSTPNCLGDASHFTELSTNPLNQGYIQQWVWNYGDGSPNDTVTFPSTANPTHTYANAGTYLVTLSIMNSRLCTDTYSTTITISRRALPDFSFWSNCQDQTAIFQDQTNLNGGGQVASWLWTFGDPTSGALNTSTLQNPTHIYSAAGTYNVLLWVTNFNGCADSISRDVVVKGAPDAEFINAPGCLTSPTLFWADSLLINVPATATYAWNFGDGATAYSRNTQHTYLAAGTYTVTLTITDTAGCEGSVSHDITVTPPPAAHFTASLNNCQGQAVAFTNLSSTTAGYLNSWKWDFGDGSPIVTIAFPNTPDVTHTYAVTGIFNVTLTVTNSLGCSHSETITMNVFGAPTSDFYSSGHCLGDAVHFTDISTTTANQSISSWSWTFGDPTSGVFNTSDLQNPTHTYAAAGNYTVSLKTYTANGCHDSVAYQLTILPLPVADFVFEAACQGNPAQFNPSGMALGTIASWFWNFGDGNTSTLQAPSHIYTFAGTYSVTLSVTDTSGCSRSVTHPLTIVTPPVVNFDFNSPNCDDMAVQFNDLSTAPAGYIVRWTWDFGDGNTQSITFPSTASVSHTYTQGGTFNVSLWVKTSDSCSSLLSKTLTVLPKPSADFNHGSACLGASVSFTDASLSNTTGGITTWNWNFGDPTSGTFNSSTLQNPTHIFNTAGTYSVKLKVFIAGGCYDSIIMPVVVTPPPTVDFSAVAGCGGDTTSFTSSALVNVPATQSWYWSFGDGLYSTLVDPVHIYAMAGTYTVSLTITDTAGCINTKTNSITVTAGPTANFSFSTPACSSTAVTFTDLGNANGTTLNLWHWTFGDGSDTTFTTYHPTLTHTYSQPGTFIVSLSLSTQEGCTATVQIPLSISPAPLADFDFTNTCQALPTQFTDLTSLNGGTILISHAWDFGDPSSGSANTSTAASPTHTFTAPGTYTVTLITQNASGCADTLDKPVTVVPKPGVEFFTDSLTCLGSMTSFFTDTIITPVGAVQAFNWNFGDGTTSSNLQNPTHTYTVAGTFNVTLSIADTSGCQNIISHPVTIHNAPSSSFTFLSACAEAATQFTDLSLAPAGDTLVSWYWDFNLASPGTDTSALQNPTHTYILPGTYTVSLTTKTEHGCSDTKTMPLQVWNKPTAHFKYTASPCANGLVQFQDSSWSYQATVTSWNWEFEPYQYGTGQNPTHSYYAVDSCYDVKLMITDLRGCVDTLIKPVCVPPQLTATFTYQQACFSQPMTFSPQLLTPPPAQDSLITFSWNFGDPASGNQNNSTQKHPSHIYSAPGFYTINFTTTDMFGCQATDYQSVQVHALPVAVFSYDPGSCDSTLTFTSASIDTAAAITTLYWDFGDGTLDTLYAPAVSVTHKYSTPGTYTATLTVEDANGCTSTVTDSVRRAPCIVAAYIASDTLLCQNYSLNFSDLSTCDGTISQWVWTWGDTSQPVSYNVYQALTPHTFTQPGTFLVKLKVTTLVGGTPVSDSATRVVTVVSTPLAGFTTENLCLNQPAQFTDTSQSNGATLLTYRWLFDDPLSVYDTAVVRNPSYTYPAPGTYNPQLVLTNQAGCRDTATTAITVYGLPAASFNHSLSCVGQPTLFFDHSDPYLAPLYLWGWRVSDSLDRFIGTMQGDRPEFTFDSAGTYYIRLTASDTNQCADTLSAVVHTRPSPLTAFSYTENVDNVQGQLQFSDGSIGAAEYHWDFGNGEISPAQSPTITYAEDGNYTITLVTLNEDGCSDTATMQYNMLFKGLWVPNAFAPGGTWQQTRLWKPVGVNLASYSCQVYNSHGMLIWESKLLDDKGAPSEYWDGTFKDHPVQQDVYVWKIQAIFRDGTIWDNKDVGEHEGMHGEVYGNIVLIR